MTGTCAACLHTNQFRSYLNHLVYINIKIKVEAMASNTNVRVDYWMLCVCHVDCSGVFCGTVLCTLGLYRIL